MLTILSMASKEYRTLKKFATHCNRLSNLKRGKIQRIPDTIAARFQALRLPSNPKNKPWRIRYDTDINTTMLQRFKPCLES
jgi:hypothetical protein